MLFTSLSFFIFFAIVLIFYYALPKKCQWVVLLIASLAFYVTFSWKFLFFILSTILTIYGATYGIEKINSKQADYLEKNPELTLEAKKEFKAKNKKTKKTYVTLCILFNIGILFVLKYANFFASNFVGLVNLFGANLSPVVIKLILPLGISFYSFQAVGYLLDVYWGKNKAEKNIFKLALFISFFPQIIQGPISRYSELAPQFTEEKSFDYDRLISGITRILWGLLKKLVIADALATIVNTGFDKVVELNGLQTWVTILAYLIQDYMDFSGCIDIAIGAGECLGIVMPENFKRPYFARTVEDYWRRWHATLGSWFKDYIFYPISISKFSLKFGKFCKKHSKPNSYLAKQMPAILGLIIVWLTTGLWHGASWNYVCWGLYYGLLVILSIVCKPLYTKVIFKLKIKTESWGYKLFQWLRTIYLLCIGRIIFRCASLSDAWVMFTKTFTFIFKYNFNCLSMLTAQPLYLVPAGIALLAVIAVDLFKEFKDDISIRKTVSKYSVALQTFIMAVLIVVIILYGSYGPGYTAQDFIYMQF